MNSDRQNVLKIINAIDLGEDGRIKHGDRIDAVRAVLTEWAMENQGFDDGMEEMLRVVDHFNAVYCDKPEAGETNRETLRRALSKKFGTLHLPLRGTAYDIDDLVEEGFEAARCDRDGDIPSWWPS